MPYTTELSVEPDLLRITAEGVYDFRELFGFIEFIKSRGRAARVVSASSSTAAN